jgi:hypothetical protein
MYEHCPTIVRRMGRRPACRLRHRDVLLSLLEGNPQPVEGGETFLRVFVFSVVPGVGVRRVCSLLRCAWGRYLVAFWSIRYAVQKAASLIAQNPTLDFASHADRYAHLDNELPVCYRIPGQRITLHVRRTSLR